MQRFPTGTAVIILMTALAGIAAGQRYTSPPATASVKISGKQISVDYYSPSMHGRRIFGALVPYGRVWCPGANVATGLTTEADLRIGNLKLPKGAWSIWAIPDEHDWTLVINKETGQHHLDYDPSQDFARTKMEVTKLPSPVEAFRIDLISEGQNKGKLALVWETTEASVQFTVAP
jgi:Protein of unknown function (DUF2911)